MTPLAGSQRIRDSIPETDRNYFSYLKRPYWLTAYIAAYSAVNRRPDLKPDHPHFSKGVRKKWS
jgi:hypothetical protein